MSSLLEGTCGLGLQCLQGACLLRPLPGEEQLPVLPGRGALTVVLRRREDDGTFVVMMQSVEHPAAPAREPPFYNWRAPIRAQVTRVHGAAKPLKSSVSWLDHAQ